ncbi:transposase (fragment) [Candidatus Desulfosporosinus infrequens]|uniref:Transposase n=1 Tax=Candidatus Desulfosporosinus infrequens TaxID=2043169 RepID=A0A2U3LKJ9_9FIRM
MPAVFDKKNTEVEQLKKEHSSEKEDLINQIGQLTVDVNWLKKKQEQVSEIRKRRN